MADENKLQALRISPGFLDNLQKERNLSHEAFLAACGLNQQRFDELCEGACPSYLILQNRRRIRTRHRSPHGPRGARRRGVRET